MAICRYVVDDVDVAVEFYSAIGFEFVNRPGPPFAELRRGDLSLWVSGPGSSASRPLASRRIEAEPRRLEPPSHPGR
jgi:hypothetical protein